MPQCKRTRSMEVYTEYDVHDPETAEIEYERRDDGWYVKTPENDDFWRFASKDARPIDVRQLINKKWNDTFGDPDPLDDRPPQYPDLPRGWEWWSGSRGSGHYTRWFGTEFQMGGALVGKHGLGGYEGQVYWDEGGDGHIVHIYPITGKRADGDPEVGEYPVARGRYDTEQEALDAVPGLIEGLKE